MWEDRQTEARNRARCSIDPRDPWCRNLGGMGADMPVKYKAPPPPPPPVWASTWIKVLGAWTERKVEDAINLGAGGTFAIDLGYRQDTYGIIGGLDVGKQGFFNPYDAVVFGIMGGYLDSKVKFNQLGTTFRYTGGTVGTWGSWMSNGWFVDATGKADFLTLSFNTPIAGLVLPETDVRNLGFIGNVGYRWDWGRFFSEPIATLTYVKTHIDDVLPTGARLTWNDGESLRGAIGARTGVAFLGWWGKRVEASITARLWDEWRSSNSVLLQAAGGAAELSDTFRGAFWEVKGNVDFLSIAPGWSGFFNAGVKWNDEFHTVNAKAGVNYKWGWR